MKSQESVWDYPIPPRLEASAKHITVRLGSRLIAESRRTYRVLETSHPPVYYIPREDILDGVLHPTEGASFCEWKGRAAYFDIVLEDRRVNNCAWTYPNPSKAFEPIRDYIAFYPSLMDECRVDGVLVKPQEGDFYGGWITPDILGPFKGGPGTMGW